MERDITNLVEILPSVSQMIESIKTCKDKTTKSVLRKSLRRLLQYSSECGKYTYSMGAKSLCENKGIDIHKLNRTHPNTKLLSKETPNKPIMLLEHPYPLSEFMDDLMKTPKELLLVSLMKYPPLVWITRQENDLLNSNGFNRKRPGGWKKCYEKCEIILCGQVF